MSVEEVVSLLRGSVSVSGGDRFVPVEVVGAGRVVLVDRELGSIVFRNHLEEEVYTPESEDSWGLKEKTVFGEYYDALLSLGEAVVEITTEVLRSSSRKNPLGGLPQEVRSMLVARLVEERDKLVLYLEVLLPEGLTDSEAREFVGEVLKHSTYILDRVGEVVSLFQDILNTIAEKYFQG